jgi:hypothetical protein
MIEYPQQIVVRTLAVILACGLGPGISERSRYSPHQGSEQGFIPQWSIGDWWEVGYARVPRTRGHEILYNQGIDKPTWARRLEVLGETEFRGRLSYMIGCGPYL